jgi:hypothetical protein
VDSDVVIAIETGLILGKPWPPPGVPDDADTRGMRDEIAAAIAALPEGVAPDVPSEWPGP